MDQIKSNELPSAEVLSREEMEELLPELNGLITWAKGVQEYALQAALKGEKFSGYKVVEGRTVRKWSDPDAVKDVILKGSGIPEAMLYKPKEMISVSDAEKLLGRVQFKSLAEQYVDSGVGKPALVPESDKRPEWGVSAAEADFKEVLK